MTAAAFLRDIADVIENGNDPYTINIENDMMGGPTEGFYRTYLPTGYRTVTVGFRVPSSKREAAD